MRVRRAPRRAVASSLAYGDMGIPREKAWMRAAEKVVLHEGVEVRVCAPKPAQDFVENARKCLWELV